MDALAPPEQSLSPTALGGYSGFLVLSLVLAFAFKARTEGIFACPAAGYTSDAYLAYCQAEAYGDYDHGAVWFGLEPRVGFSAAKAQVLFLGTSRMQYAFSTAATEDWFTTRGFSFYLLGFSHSENIEFVEPLLTRLKPAAEVYVVNIDEFFEERESGPAASILREHRVLSRYRQKRAWQFAHRNICGWVPQLCGKQPAFYRSVTWGAWTLSGEGFDEAEVADDLSGSSSDWIHLQERGTAFLESLSVPRECIILTIVPWQSTPRAQGEALARQLGLPVIAPRLEGLRTFDGSHLDPSSAQRWSNAFFDSAGKRIAKCLNQGNAGSTEALSSPATG